SASAVADEDCRLLILPKSDLRRLLLADAKLCFALLKTFSARLRRANEEIESLLFQNILGRVAKRLLELVAAGDKPVAPGSALPRRYTHQELAELVGTTREPLSRALSTLRRAGVLESRDELLIIADPERLAAMAGLSASSEG
ncbi:MAG TPA: Crp/Fnr family transcriptional regulator, partial [Elusimicrobiota bacterium]|nr:Crp/Fnr family transcriptional regulator [Elusimicrobiota bacterium]